MKNLFSEEFSACKCRDLLQVSTTLLEDRQGQIRLGSSVFMLCIMYEVLLAQFFLPVTGGTSE
jgi:hypothetical protein